MQTGIRIITLFILTLCLEACGSTPSKPSPQQPELPEFSDAGQYYPTQTPHCVNQLSSHNGHIQWLIATSSDSPATIRRYFNHKTGLTLRKYGKKSSMWSITNKNPSLHRTLSVMTLDEASRLRLLCGKAVNHADRSAIVVSNFIPKKVLQ